MRWLLLIGPLVAAITVWTWRTRFRLDDEPDLVPRYRAAWAIPNETIRKVQR